MLAAMKVKIQGTLCDSEPLRANDVDLNTRRGDLKFTQTDGPGSCHVDIKLEATWGYLDSWD